uniref:Splicing factor Cactin n=1 Tax=Caenorhabditis japonica TaxID=281687 RepID=A0A8R1ED91_CAEJA
MKTQNKSIEELLKLENQIDDKLRGNQGNKSYWQNLESQLKVFIARKRIREHHGRQLRLQLVRIKEEQKKEIDAAAEQYQQHQRLLSQLAPPVNVKPKKEEVEVEEVEEEEEDEDEEEKMAKKVRRKVDVTVLEDPELDEQERERKWRALTNDQLEEVTQELYRIGCYSPPYNNFDDTMPGIEILDVQADTEILMERREMNRKNRPTGSDPAPSNSVDPKMMAIARQGMEGDESTFSVEEQLETQKHLWSDKYRPRKPTYLNRVQTGFDWNKYNQTHYDQDNPPPKIVQGYKFNIFYPDLLDVTKTPTFTVTPCDDRDFAIIRFKSGPPYEDIAFKVVNREWETLYKNGYKCQFQNGVFQLWFMFKKYRYRR